jgi:hypothetical protein
MNKIKFWSIIAAKISPFWKLIIKKIKDEKILFSNTVFCLDLCDLPGRRLWICLSYIKDEW